MQRFWRVAVMVLVALVACGFSISYLQKPKALAIAGCGSAGPSDPAYSVAVSTRPNPPRALGTDVLVQVQKAGQPVSGAAVCLSLDMVGMPMGSLVFHGIAQSPGVYSIFLSFGMGGRWVGNLVVSAGGRTVHSEPVAWQIS